MFQSLIDMINGNIETVFFRCYGVVIFAGKDTKLMMNSGKTKFKRTSLDRFLNILIVGIVLFLIAMCLICTILCAVWEYQTGRYFTMYLPWDDIVPNPEQRGAFQKRIVTVSERRDGL